MKTLKAVLACDIHKYMITNYSLLKVHIPCMLSLNPPSHQISSPSSLTREDKQNIEILHQEFYEHNAASLTEETLSSSEKCEIPRLEFPAENQINWLPDVLMNRNLLVKTMTQTDVNEFFTQVVKIITTNKGKTFASTLEIIVEEFFHTFVKKLQITLQ